MNLKPKEFWDELSPRDFLKMCEGFNFRFKREYAMYINQLKVIRWVGSMIYNVNVKKSNRKDPDQLFSLPEIQEEKKQKVLPTKAEMEEMKNWI